MPYLELAMLAAFFLLIVWAMMMKKEGEQQRLFAGMAKETAHQLGTPLTAMMGWLQILHDRHGEDDEVITELGRDVTRLTKVAERFSRIGSQPRLDLGDLTETIRSTLVYFERRLPHLGGRVDLRLEGAIRNRVRFNRELFEWVLENLIKNGIDALKDGRGTIAVRLEDGPGAGVTVLRVRHRRRRAGRAAQPHFRTGLHDEDAWLGHGPGAGAPHRDPVPRRQDPGRRQRTAGHDLRHHASRRRGDRPCRSGSCGLTTRSMNCAPTSSS